MNLCNNKNLIKHFFAIVLAFSMAIGIFPVTAHAEDGIIGATINEYSEGSEEEFRAVWVGTVFGLNYPSKPTTDENQLKKDAIAILDHVKEMGFNTVIFQVRPASDSLYPSQIFPWSKYLTGTQGVAPANQFDPLDFFVTEAHARGLKLHAWLNPYRVTATKADSALLSPNNPAVLHPELTVTHTDGKIYWNPGEPQARNYVLKGIQEIVDNYDVDGIHIDDYFYPEGTFDDSKTFAKYGQTFAHINDWRRNNNDQLVKDIYTLVHNNNKNIVFGVSPRGIWANKSAQNPNGSDTRGQESYSANFADSKKWVKEEYVDYIVPQIYWHSGFDIADYSKLVPWWCDVVKGTNVKLYIGQAAYRAGNTDVTNPWYGTKELKQQVLSNRTNDIIKGYVMYSYSSFKTNQELITLMKELNNTILYIKSDSK